MSENLGTEYMWAPSVYDFQGLKCEMEELESQIFIKW